MAWRCKCPCSVRIRTTSRAAPRPPLIAASFGPPARACPWREASGASRLRPQGIQALSTRTDQANELCRPEGLTCFVVLMAAPHHPDPGLMLEAEDRFEGNGRISVLLRVLSRLDSKSYGYSDRGRRRTGETNSDGLLFNELSLDALPDPSLILC